MIPVGTLCIVVGDPPVYYLYPNGNVQSMPLPSRICTVVAIPGLFMRDVCVVTFGNFPDRCSVSHWRMLRPIAPPPFAKPEVTDQGLDRYWKERALLERKAHYLNEFHKAFHG